MPNYCGDGVSNIHRIIQIFDIETENADLNENVSLMQWAFIYMSLPITWFLCV